MKEKEYIEKIKNTWNGHIIIRFKRKWKIILF
jgi:hypothetical protein